MRKLLIVVLLLLCGPVVSLHTRTEGAYASSSAAYRSGLVQPNVVFILVDDLGYGDLTCYNPQSLVPTPNIDRLALAGARFTRFYVTCPQCAPSRAAIFTGRYAQRYGIEENGDIDTGGGLPLDQPTIAERLKPYGYVTSLIGKWHLGTASPYLPQQRGFDSFFGFTGAANDYLPSSVTHTVRGVVRGTAPNPALTDAHESEYLTDAIGRECETFIGKHSLDPFLLCATFNAVHEPLAATQIYLDRVNPAVPTTQKTRAAVLIALDDNVGRILRALTINGLDADTLVVFLSDNGATADQYNYPYRGGKLRSTRAV